MINEYYAKMYCKEDISKIENYDKAISDSTQIWHCHHRDEVKVLPSGMTILRSRQDLIDNECYYHRKACELIFLTPTEHHNLHNKGKHLSDETRKKCSTVKKGKNHPLYGKHHSDAAKIKMSKAHKGKTWKLIDGKRVWISKEAE